MLLKFSLENCEHAFVQFSSVAQSCLTLCDPHGLQHIRSPCLSPTARDSSNSCLWAGDAIQLSHPLSSPSPPILNLFQYQGLYFLYLSLSLYFSLFLSLFYFLTLQYCIGFTIYQHESSGSFQMRQLFTSGSQSIGVSASIAALPMNIQDWAPLQWTGWISLQSKGFSRIFSNTRVQKHQFFGAQLPL